MPPGCLTEPKADSEVLFGTAEWPDTDGSQMLDTKCVKDKIIGQYVSKCNNNHLLLNFLLLM